LFSADVMTLPEAHAIGKQKHGKGVLDAVL